MTARRLRSAICLPFLIAAWVARYVPAGEGPLLDAGCGTGLSGPTLKALGYDDIAGLDLSQDMLAIAGSRDAYSELKQAELGGPLPWPDGHFRAFFSTGVFTIGHAPASGLARARAHHAEAAATPSSRCATRCLRAAASSPSSPSSTRQGKWRPVEESPWFRAFAIAEPEALVKTFVFEIL